MKQTRSLQDILDEEVSVDLGVKLTEFDGKRKIIYNQWAPEGDIEELKAVLKKLNVDIPIEGIPF